MVHCVWALPETAAVDLEQVAAEGGALVRVPLVGGLSFTPSEFIRLAVAFLLAQYLAANARVLRNLRQPLGVTAGITPFNFPVMVPLWMAPVAIATGNTFILKPSERDPSPSLILADLFRQAPLLAQRATPILLVEHADILAFEIIRPGVIFAAELHRPAAAIGEPPPAMLADIVEGANSVTLADGGVVETIRTASGVGEDE